MSASTASTAISERAAIRRRSCGKATSPPRTRRSPTASCTDRCKLANVLKDLGVKKGDRVTIYMPMIPETAYAMLARPHRRDPFGGVRRLLARQLGEPDQRLRQQARDHDRRRQARRAQRPAQGQHRRGAEEVRGRRRGADVSLRRHRRRLRRAARPRRLPAARGGFGRLPARADERRGSPVHPLYLGPTGKPKGVLHTTGGYLVYVALTHEYVFDYHEGDVYRYRRRRLGHRAQLHRLRTARERAISVMFEGVPNYPDASRFWQVVDKHQVNIFYTAPTAIRALMRLGAEPVRRPRAGASSCSARSASRSIRGLALVLQRRGRAGAPIVDTWWQTETGGILITPLPGATALKPGRRPVRSSVCSPRSWTATAGCSRGRARATWSC